MSTKTKDGIPDHYRQWAKQEAEKEYPRKMWPEGTLDEVRRQRNGYEAALLRMWPLVDALQRISEKSNWYANNGARLPLEVDHALCVEIPSEADTALSSLNLPKANSNGEDQE